MRVFALTVCLAVMLSKRQKLRRDSSSACFILQTIKENFSVKRKDDSNEENDVGGYGGYGDRVHGDGAGATPGAVDCRDNAPCVEANYTCCGGGYYGGGRGGRGGYGCGGGYGGGYCWGNENQEG